MHNHCEVCQEDLRRETGFYFGSAYVSYGLTVAFGIGLFLVMCTWLNVDILTYLITFSIALVVLMPLFYRYSRLIWIHLFVRYRGGK
jgi:flagellar biosynthesis protein FliP